MFLLFHYKGNKEVLRRSCIHHSNGIENLLYYSVLHFLFVYMKQEERKSPQFFLGSSNEPLELKPFYMCDTNKKGFISCVLYVPLVLHNSMLEILFYSSQQHHQL